MKIAICDDNEIDRSIIIEFLHIYSDEKSITAEYTQYESGVSLYHDVDDGISYDLIFLDIFMAEIHGMDIARHLRDHGYSGKIIFITATADFAVDSYEVEAAGYLLKPHDYKKFAHVMDRIIDQTYVRALQFSIRNTVYSVPFNEITYVDSYNNVCCVHRSDRTEYTIYQKLGDIETQLNDPRFLRCHRSCIVNMSYISKVDSNFELTTGDTVLIRQKDIKRIREIYINYINQGKSTRNTKRKA